MLNYKLLKHSYAYSINLLQNYTERNVISLVSNILFNNVTAKHIPVQTGIISAESFNVLNDSFDMQKNVSLAQYTLNVNPVNFNKSWYPDELEAKWNQFVLNSGNKYDELPLEEALTDFITEIVSNIFEKAYWLGNNVIDNASKNINYFDGFIKIINDATNVVNGNVMEISKITSLNAYFIHTMMFDVLPKDILDKDDIIFFEGWDTFRKLVLALKTDGFISENDIFATGELVLPGTNIRVVATHALNDTDRIFAGRASNFYIGTDLFHDFENVNIRYDKNNDKIFVKGKWKAGVQIMRLNNIVQYKNA